MLLDKESEGPSLVVAPASVVPNWRNELQRFAPTLSVTILNAAEDRDEAIKEAQAGDVVVSTYALINICREQLAAKEWNIICLDEAHTIKNPNTKMSKAAMTLQAKRKVILTGTPIQNHLSELWNLFQFINHRTFRQCRPVWQEIHRAHRGRPRQGASESAPPSHLAVPASSHQG